MKTAVIKTKECRDCNIQKPLFDFYRNIKNKDGLAIRCIECVKSRKKPTELEKLRRRVNKMSTGCKI